MWEMWKTGNSLSSVDFGAVVSADMRSLVHLIYSAAFSAAITKNQSRHKEIKSPDAKIGILLRSARVRAITRAARCWRASASTR